MTHLDSIPVCIAMLRFRFAIMRYQRLTKYWEHGFNTESVLHTRSIFYAMCAEVDAMVGALLDELDLLGLADNTYFVFSSDHGENNMEHRQWYKMNFYESSARVPLVVAGPGVGRGKILDPNMWQSPKLLQRSTVERPQSQRSRLHPWLASSA